MTQRRTVFFSARAGGLVFSCAMVLVLSACSTTTPTASQTDSKANGQAGSIPDDTQLQSWFATAKSWVEQETKTSLATVPLKLITRSELSVYGDTALATLFTDRPVSYQLLKELKKLGHADTRSSVVALYDPVQNAVLLPQEALLPFSNTVKINDTAQPDAFTALFVHELTHAADYINYPENIMFDQDNLGNLAVRAVVEGHAQYLSKIICQKQGCEDGYRTLRDDVVSGLGDASAMLDNPAQTSEALTNFSYFHGERFFSAIESHPGVIEAVLASPPTDPVMILYPEVYLKGERKRRQDVLQGTFKEIKVPWEVDRSVVLHNSNFVPFEGYNTQRQLAQSNYEVLHESSSGVDTTNVNIFWQNNSSSASDFYQQLIMPNRKRITLDGNYLVRLLSRSSSRIPAPEAGGNAWGSNARIGNMVFSYTPTKAGQQKILPERIHQIVVTASGPYVVSVARFSAASSQQDLQGYAMQLLDALQY